MWRFVWEVLSYVIFICIIYVISFSSRNYEEYVQAIHLRQLFLNPNSLTLMYSQITTINQYWQWLEESFIKNIVVEDWYNGQPDNASQGYINDKTNRLIGWATMRQLRVKADTCRIKPDIHKLISHCYDEYSASTEERGSFLPGWTTNITSQNYSSSINKSFIYQTSEQLDTYVYLGALATYLSGGYVYKFRGSLSKFRDDLSQLHRLGWIDVQTRAVIIQMNLYNPNIRILTSVVIVIELPSSSGVFPSAQFDPLDTAAFQSVFQIICIFIYFIFIIYFMIVEIRSFIHFKKLYIRQFWSYIELGVIVCSWTGVGIHVWRTNEAARITRLFRETNDDIYVNLQLLAYINDLFSFLLAFCCFFGTIRVLRLCRYNQRLDLLSSTLKRAAGELISFSFMFSIIFMAYLSLFYLEFASDVRECSDLLHTAQMLFEMLLLKFDTTRIATAAPFLGPLYFTIFIFFVVFVCINMFVSIINDNFRCVRADAYKTHSVRMAIFSRFIKKLQQCCGDKKLNVEIIDEKQDVTMPAEMPEPMKHLSNRLDRLLVFVNLRYTNTKVRTAWNETISNT